jgi:hypothetical protein
MMVDNVQHLPIQEKSKENEHSKESWLGQSTDNTEKLPVASLCQGNFPSPLFSPLHPLSLGIYW